MARKKKGTLQEGAPGPEKVRDAPIDSKSMEASPVMGGHVSEPGGQISNLFPEPPEQSVSTAPEASAETPPEADTFSHAQADFPIVGIGASAGGLAAFEAFFSGIPAGADPGMAFVLVQHLAPDHKSILVELIRRYTHLQVFEVTEGMVVKPNCIYIIPPNREMACLNGALQLLEPSNPRGQRLPIDFFFQSLARDRHEQAIGIILSGTGSDGSLGVRAIKGEGGLVIAQNPASTEFDGMPRSAIATGLVDYELPPAEMPAQLIAYVARAFRKPNFQVPSPSRPKHENELKKIFVLLRARTGHDFSSYKPSTIHRRIERRMAVQRIDTMDLYVKYLQQAPMEVESLFRDMLIGVTSFFRDPEAFRTLEEKVIPQLFAGKPAGATIRIWSPGCSTGEEAYSLAILLAERQEALKQSFQVTVFATDIDSRAIAAARGGLYPTGIARNISPARLERYFMVEPGGGAYRIHKNIREMMIFSEHNVIKDPPFSKLDLISCRNLLIYISGDLQKKLISFFHYALNPGGFLFLGTSETVGELTGLFGALDRNSKLYRRKDDIDGAQLATPSRFLPPVAATTRAIDKALPRAIEKTDVLKNLTPREQIERALLQVAPAGVLVNSRGDILYLRGRTDLYLEMVQGEPSNNILKMAREGLQYDLTAALHKAVRTKEIVRCPGLPVKSIGGQAAVNLTVHPVTTNPAASPETSRYLVILEEAIASIKATAGQADSPDATAGTDADARVAALTEELRAKEEYLQTSHEELESSTEELKSANEEMQSVNEELQSTNEELETSKEELQSVNEELLTVNTEMQTKNADLSRANNDMNNLLAGTGIGTVFVDEGQHILRFTPPATKIMNLILSDMGRHVSHITTKLRGYDRLSEDSKMVLDTLIPQELEVQTTEGKWYLMRILPYRTVNNTIEGTVINFFDITEMKQLKEALRKAHELTRLSVVVRDSQDAITVQDLNGRIIAWNQGAERIYGWSEAEALAMNVHDRIPEDLREEALVRLHQLSRAKILKPHHTQRLAKDGQILGVIVTATALVNEARQMYAIATTERVVVRSN